MKITTSLFRSAACTAACLSWAYASDTSPSAAAASNPGKVNPPGLQPSKPGNPDKPNPTKPPGLQPPKPGDCRKTTSVKFKNPNNGWGNGDQDAPGNSGDNNNAENGPRNPPPGIAKKTAIGDVAAPESSTLKQLSNLDAQASNASAAANGDSQSATAARKVK